MSASGGKAVVRRPDFTSLRLNVRFSRKRSFRILENHENEGPLTAISGHSSDKEDPAQTGVTDECNDAHHGPAVGTLERIDLVNLLNQSCLVGLATCIDGWLVADDILISQLGSMEFREEVVSVDAFRCQSVCRCGDPHLAPVEYGIVGQLGEGAPEKPDSASQQRDAGDDKRCNAHGGSLGRTCDHNSSS